MDAPLPTDISHAAAILFRDRKLLQQVSNQSIHEVMAPLHELLRKDTMEMDQELSRRIPTCKGHDGIRCGACTTKYDLEAPTCIPLACDASSYGLGAVLSHVYKDGHHRTITFASLTLTPTERAYIYSQIHYTGGSKGIISTFMDIGSFW